MQFDDFVGQVQHRARLGSLGQSIGAVRAVLETLSERLRGDDLRHLAAQLPRELQEYCKVAIDGGSERFGLSEFLRRVALREHADDPDAIFHARVVMEVLREAVSPGAIEHLKGVLPEEFRSLIEAGSSGEFDRAPHKPAEAAGPPPGEEGHFEDAPEPAIERQPDPRLAKPS